MKINTKLLEFLQYEGLNSESKLYRFTLEDYVKKHKNGSHIISANPQATEMVEDIYESGHSMMAKFIDKGLAFTTAVEEDFRTKEHVLISIRVKDIIDQGGLIYPDVSSFTSSSKAYFVTIPRGEIAVTKLDA